MGNNFYFHRNWTFADQRDKPARKQFSKFFAVNLSSLAISNMMVLLLTPSLYSMLPDPAMGNLLVKGCASGAGMCFNFVANQLWTFRDTRRI
jgi:putative flippase GtrA